MHTTSILFWLLEAAVYLEGFQPKPPFEILVEVAHKFKFLEGSAIPLLVVQQ